MAIINLTATTKEHLKIKKYLQSNASDYLAEKINNGVKIIKNDKEVINKKDLESFMKYASQEAQKTVEKGLGYTCVDDDVVFGWAIHYFEEESIEGKLYNLDGSEYKEPVKKLDIPISKPAYKPENKPKSQFSLFDLISEKENKLDDTDKSTTKEDEYDAEENTSDEEEFEEEEKGEFIEEKQQTLITVTSDKKSNFNVDLETGEILNLKEKVNTTTRPKNTVYEKYMYYQNKYPQSVIAYRLGDFFEIFGQYAIDVAKELDLTLTGRDCGTESRIPMVGYPYHVSKDYVEELRKKHSVVVVDNDDVTTYEKAQPQKQNKEILTKAFEKTALYKLFEMFDNDITIPEGDITND